MRRLLAMLCLSVCVLSIFTSVSAGLSQHYSKDGIASARIASTVAALKLAPDDPLAHYAHALVLEKAGLSGEAIAHLSKATQLKPQDYILWSELGRMLRQSGDKQGALVPLEQAVQLAQYYAQPRWDLGTLLLELGRPSEGFAQLSRAGASDPNLFIEVVKLAWQHLEGNPAAVLQATQPQTSDTRMKLARFFVWKGFPDESVALVRETKEISPRNRDELAADLVAGKWFPQAFEVWSKGRETDPRQTALVSDGGFEPGAQTFSRTGFGWNHALQPGAVRINFDRHGARDGEQSLRFEWNGITNASVPALTQLVLVEPGTTYQLSYSARTRDLVSGTPPFIGVVDAGNDQQEFLARSASVPGGTMSWQDYAFEFSTPNDTRAIRIVIQRPKCDEAPCPIFGRLWLDSVSLRKLR